MAFVIFHRNAQNIISYTLPLLCVLTLVSSNCPKRQVLTESSGNISMSHNEYPLNDYCQWFIQGDAQKYVIINFDELHTECDYDYLYIYDGDSFSSPLLGVYSGSTIPDVINAQSGSVLVHFYSDLNFKPGQGEFKLRYKLSDCKHECAPCSNKSCVCGEGQTGDGCEIAECSTAQGCSDRGTCYRDVLDGDRYCNCDAGYAGRSCDLDLSGPVSNEGNWTQLAPADVGFERRAGHSAVYDSLTESVWVYGGYSMPTPTDELIAFSLNTSRWQIETKAGPWPQASYQHKAAQIGNCMYIAGGRSETSFLSQFWRFCFDTKSWTQLPDMPDTLTDHTLTAVDEWLYIVGGLNAQQQFSSRVIRYDTLNGAGGIWQEVKVKSGRVKDYTVAGHSTIYHTDTRSLIVFGGHVPSSARFSRHSGGLHTFHVDTQHWSTLSPTSPDSMAYHTANLMGNYMVVYGGQRGRSDTLSCINNNVYAYHLVCHRWVSLSAMYTSLSLTEPTGQPDTKGRHSHTSVVVNGNLLLVVGGFRGNVLGDIWSYQVFTGIAWNTNEALPVTSTCENHWVYAGCMEDAECIWCGAPPYSGCTSRYNAGNCPNPKLPACPGLCSALTDCHSCVVQSHNVTQPSYPSLRQQEQCAWCIHDSTCQPLSDLSGTCQLPSVVSNVWWKGGATLAVDQSQCASMDNKPAGLRYALYYSPPNYQLPDVVNSSDSSEIRWVRKTGVDGAMNSRVQFYIHPNNITSSDIHLRLVVQNNKANVTMQYKGETIVLGSIDPVGTTSNTNNLGVFPPNTPAFQSSGPAQRYLVHIDAWNMDDKLTSPMYGLQWDAFTGSSYQVIAKELVEPYSSATGGCSGYRSCLSCQLDLACGWCASNSQCVGRSNTSLSAAECGTDNPDQWLITDPSLCDECTYYIDCQDCTATGVCEWVSDDIRCQRLGLSADPTTVLLNTSSCPSLCIQRGNCSECLADGDECIWCDSTQSCDQFSPYLLTNSFGQCQSWRENHEMSGSCDVCETQQTCSDCISMSACGWCGNDFNPNIGICMRGDYSTPLDCSVTLHTALNVSSELLSLNLSLALINSSNVQELSTNASFSYTVCPDVKECLLGLDECHENSTCVNTAQSYECLCNQGFEGDGKEFCNKTCFYECVNGECSGPPLYQCNCDLGWTNITCDTDCGCNNHSTCVNGTGSCDLCQENTWGEYCEFCLPKSYGNATIFPGCLSCDCNGHGIEDMDLCNMSTGVCFCEEGFQGNNCELCDETSTGDPRNGQLCYEYSHNRLVVYNATGRHGVTSSGRYHDVTYTRWIITPFSDLDTPYSTSGLPLLTITIDSINTSCPLGYVYVYDGINTDDSLGNAAAYCGSTDRSNTILNSVDIYTGYATIVYYGNGTKDQAFTASYSVHECNESCHGNRFCDGNGECRCIVDTGGTNCELLFCAVNCSSHGYCNQASQTCFCDEGYSGEDCSQESYVTVNRLLEGVLVAVSPSARNDFTVVDCGTEGSVLFGGFSTEEGLLNDLWRFDGISWHLITPANGQVPAGRHQHAAACILTQQTYKLIIHGGVVRSSESKINTTSDLWIFDFSSLVWSNQMVETTELAGHTMTQVSDSTLITVGGYSLLSDWSNETYTYHMDTNAWLQNVGTTGAVPAGLMMHTAVYHPSSDALYVHGGYRYYIDTHRPSNETFFYIVSTHRWYKRSDEYISHTARRYSHSAIQLNDSLLVIGGIGLNEQYELSLSLYSYSCDRWHNVGNLPTGTSGHSATINSSLVYIFSSTLQSLSVDVLSLPQDVCTLYSGIDSTSCLGQRGCHACNVSGEYVCFDKRLSPPQQCIQVNGTAEVLSTTDTCDADGVVVQRDCKAHKDCAQCLTSWPYHGSVPQKCKWCSFCNKGMCIQTGQICSIENPCDRTQSPKYNAEICVEQRCRSATCDQCQTEAPEEEGCIWTRQFMRSSEVGRQVSAIPFMEWNCVTRRLIGLSTIQVWSAPPSQCPIPCQRHTTCTSCLDTDGGGVGGYAACYWSSRLNLCLTPVTLTLTCKHGLCAPLIESGDTSVCPVPCSAHTQCGDCLANPYCGWCSEGDESLGQGACMEGNGTHPFIGSCSSSSVSGGNSNMTSTYTWHFMDCPLENECNTSHHRCDLERQDCTDLDLGHYCTCKDGYKLIDDQCIPQCNPNCVHGECVKPQICDCDFSWVGLDCSIACQCNQHSDCAGPNATTTCTGCIANTIGDQCEMCDKLAVGDATDGGACEICFTVCNNHASVCMDNYTRHNLVLQPNQSITEAYLDYVSHGPIAHKDVVCIDCANNTEGSRCDSCKPGYFRLSGDPTAACTACKCNGHSFTCNELTGASCDCSNNTVSPCQSDDNCYKQQCNQCTELYVGTPVSGHQCYLRLLSDETYCISRSQGALPVNLREEASCAEINEPLPQGQAFMFAVLPKFLNVDIKIYINIDIGEADIYIGKAEDIFIIRWDPETNKHVVSLDSKYQVDLNGRKKRDIMDVKSRVRRDTSNTTYNLVVHDLDPLARSNYVYAKPNEDYFDSLYHLRGAKRRVVVTLPEFHHNLKLDKFYVVLISRSSSTSGTLQFRQDQIRIELFVFFAVFFSCFFKFLSICVIVWKIKSLYNQQQQRIQRAVELDQMASRPFGSLLVHFEEEFDEDGSPTVPLKSRKPDFQINPAACEFTDDGVAVVGSVMFEMPGGKDAPARAMFGSALMTLRVLYPNRKTVTERHKELSSNQRTTQT